MVLDIIVGKNLKEKECTLAGVAGTGAKLGNILEGLSKLAAAAMIKQSLKVMSRWSTEFRYWQGLENIQLNIP